MNINLITPINTTGYGVTSLNVLKSLVKLGHKVSFFPIGGIETDLSNKKLIGECLVNSNLYDALAPTIKIYHQFGLEVARSIFQGQVIGFPIFELDRFNQKEINSLNSVDKLAVCSKWAKEVCLDNNLKFKEEEITVVPLGVDRDIFNENISAPISSPLQTTFINCGKWEYRKGHDILCKAFNQAFSVSDDVQLIMVNSNPFLTEQEVKGWVDYYKNSKLGQKIKIVENRLSTQRDLAKIMAEAHCGIFPSRAEGWNLEALELLSIGKDLIITDYSAHTEFCHPENSILIPIQEKELAFDGKWFFNQGSWAKFDGVAMDCLINEMQQYHKQKTKTINLNGIETAKYFSWDHTAKMLLKAIDKGER